MFLMSFNIYFVFGYACSVCVCYLAFFGTRSGCF